jgi:microsomal dipeptidase-like Zn-dependent dipeptidase
MNEAPIKRKVGDKVILSHKAFQNIVNGNRSIHAFPSDSYIEKIRKHIGCIGVVTHTWTIGFDATIDFNGESFHMKDHWVSNQ